jgi:hypothetical protein
MPVSARAQARSAHEAQRSIVLAAVRAIRILFRGHDRSPIRVATTLTGYQAAAATVASRRIADYAGTPPLARPLAFAGTTAAGFPLTDPLAPLIADFEAQIEGGALALLDRIERLVASEVADAGRAAAQAEIVARPDWTNYVRVLNPPSCARCAILAGRIYRDLDGFARHPLCDCIHWPVESWDQAHDLGLVFSAKDAFEKDQVRGLSKADAQAISDGANISQVVNAARGMSTADIFGRRGVKSTTAGTTKRSAWRKANPDRAIRLRPEAIYEAAKDAEDAIRLLRLYGYLTT